MRVYHDFVLVPGSKSAFPDTDPDPDPAKWYGSETLLINVKILNPKASLKSNKLSLFFRVLLASSKFGVVFQAGLENVQSFPHPSPLRLPQ